MNEARRRLHPLSPLARLWGVVVIAGFAVARDQAGNAQDVDRTDAIAFGGIFVVVAIVVVALGYLRWSRTSYWFDDDGDFRIASGVVSRNERRVQLSRLQAVDVIRPLAARVMGLAELRIDVAGGRGSKVRLAYLGHDDAVALRAELLARSAGIEHDRSTGPVPEAPEAPLVEVPTPQLIVALCLGGPALIGVVAVVAVVAAVVITRQISLLATLFFVVITPAAVAFREFTSYFNFSLAESPDGLRIRHGLFETRAQTVPPGRVQAVGVCQPLLWRKPGWVRVYVDVAGYGDKDDASTVLLPVVPSDVAHALLQRMLPGFDPLEVALEPVPPRAKLRAPIQWRRYAAGLGDTAVVTTYGRFVRRTVCVPYARVQSVRVVQGPLQRSLHLATMHVDTPAGPVSARLPERDEHQARDWAETVAERALRARATDRSERWMAPRRPAGTPAARGVPADGPHEGADR